MIRKHLGMMGLHLVFLLWNVWDHLENNIFDCLKHNFLEGLEVLIEVVGDCEVVLQHVR